MPPGLLLDAIAGELERWAAVASAVRQVDSSGAGSFQARDPGAADDDTGHMTPARVLAHRATTAHSLRCREAECHHAEILKDEDMDSCQEVDDGIKVHSLLYHTIHV